MANKNQRNILRIKMDLMCKSILTQSDILLSGQYKTLKEDIKEYTLEKDGEDLLVRLEKYELDDLIQEFHESERRVTFDYFQKVKRLEKELENFIDQTCNEINEELL